MFSNRISVVVSKLCCLYEGDVYKRQDKNYLNRVHEGNVKKQRQVAKEKCDAIGFVSYSELWKLVKELR